MNIDIIEKRLNKLKSDWPNKKTILFRHRVSIDKEKNCVLEKYIDKQNLFYMQFPDQKKIFIGYGKAIQYISKNSFTQFSNKTYNIESNIKTDNIDIFGGASFNLKKSNSYPWSNIPKVQFNIPKFLFSFIGDNSHFTYSCQITKHFKVKDILHDIKSCMKELSTQSIKIKNKLRLTRKHLIPDKKEHLKKVDYIKEKITQKKVEKVVLSRIEEYDISKNINLYTIMEGINKTYPDCFNFLIRFKKNEYFIGSSPEKIITKNKLSYITTAIAGTSKNSDLLKNKKEIEEHSYVVKHLKHILKKYSSKIMVSKTKTLNLNYVNHLQTHIKGKTIYNIHILDLLNEIYPTPALSGYPVKKALKTINKIESFSRGWYAGAIGTYNANGDGNFYVPIRSALIKNDKIFLYSGGGIVKDSLSENEWKETKLKLEHLKSVLK